MGLIELASNNSFWRGVDYYENKKVTVWKKNDEDTYSGTVKGSDRLKLISKWYRKEYMRF